VKFSLKHCNKYTEAVQKRVHTPTPNPYPLPNYLCLVSKFNCATFFWCVYDFLAIGQPLRCPTSIACSSTTLDTCTVSSGMAISLCHVGKEQSTLLLLVSKQTILLFHSSNIPCYSGSSFLVHVRLSLAHSLFLPWEHHRISLFLPWERHHISLFPVVPSSFNIRVLWLPRVPTLLHTCIIWQKRFFPFCVIFNHMFLYVHDW